MLKNIFRSSDVEAVAIKEKKKKRRLQNSHITESGEFLLKRQEHKLLDIKTSLSINDAMYEKLYRQMFIRFAELAQRVSASESHHHSHEYGFIDHCFECVVVALRQREGFVYRSDQEDMIMQKKDVFTFAVVVGSLCHDLGKLVTDIEYYNADANVVHNIIYGPMPKGTEYVYRFYPERKIEDHKAAGLALITQVVTREGMNWLQNESALYRELIHCLSGNYIEANKLGSLVLNADRHSTSSNLKSVSDKYSQKTTISNVVYEGMDNQTVNNTVSNININSRAVAVVDALKVCLDNPETYSGGKGLNVKGTFAWVTKEFIYVVHPRCHTLIDSVLTSNGSKIKLSQPVICYAILKDAGFIDQVNNQHYTYYEINDDNGWSVSLPLLRFFRNKIDPEFKYFETKMTIKLPGDEKDDESTTTEVAVAEPTVAEISKVEVLDSEESVNAHELVDQIFSPQSEAQRIETVDIERSSPPLESYNDIPHFKEDVVEAHNQASNVELTTAESNEKGVLFAEFVKFLAKAFRTKSLDINKAGAPIHFVEGHMMLVSPSIFHSFIESVGRDKVYEILGGDKEESKKKLLTRCQYKVFSENYHIKDVALKNIIQFQAVGIRRKSKPISGILFKPDFMDLITEERFSNSNNIVLTSLVEL